MKNIRQIYLQTLGVSAEQGGSPHLSPVHAGLAGVFVLAAVPLLIAVNFVTLMFGVSVSFLGRDGVKFTFLRLWGRVRAIYVMLPVMIGYGVWHKLLGMGVIELFFSMAATLVAAVAVIGSIIVVNRLRTSR